MVTTRWQHCLSLTFKEHLYAKLTPLLPAGNNLSSGRQWETLSAGVCGNVWGGWRPVPVQQPTASFSSDLLFLRLKHTPIPVAVCRLSSHTVY